MKLSNLQKDWSLETWACFFVAFAAFWNVYALAEKKFGYASNKKAVRDRIVSPVSAMKILVPYLSAAFSVNF